MWYCQAVVGLFHVAMPLRETEEEVILYDPPHNFRKWRPSVEAQKAGSNFTLKPFYKRQESTKEKLKPRHMLGGRQKARETRVKYMTRVLERYVEIHGAIPIPSALHAAFVRMASAIFNDAQTKADDEWWDIGQYTLPPYSAADPRASRVLGDSTGGAVAYNNPVGLYPPFQGKYTESSILTASVRGDPFGGDKSTSDSNASTVRPGSFRLVTATANTGQATILRTRYYTIGEVGEHRQLDDLWVLLSDGAAGVDIYNVSGEW